jgi:hypothetical protein
LSVAFFADQGRAKVGHEFARQINFQCPACTIGVPRDTNRIRLIYFPLPGMDLRLRLRTLGQQESPARL